MLIEDNDILPATFSLSVFNTPVALASIAFNLTGGYSAIYPGKNSFYSGLMLTEAALLCGESKEIIFIYADEKIPSEYSDIFPSRHFPLSFAFLLSCNQSGSSIPLSSLKMGIDTPEVFLKRLILIGRNNQLLCSLL